MPATTTVPAALLASLLLVPTAMGQASDAGADSSSASPADARPSNPFRLSIGGGYVHQFSTDVEDSQSSLTIDRAYATLGSSWELSDSVDLGLRFAYEGGWYDFDSGNPLDLGTGQNPWTSVHGIQFGGRLGWTLNEQWSLSTSLFGAASGETGADAGDSLTFGGSVGVTWRANDRFMIGGGVLASSQLEDDALIVPLLLIDWRITDSLRLSNVTGPEAYPTSAGLELSCSGLEGWEFGFGGRWESRRFRLEDDGPAPEGVGEDEGLAIWLRAGVRPSSQFRIDMLLGVMIAEEITLDDRNGNELASVDLDPSPFIGLFASYRF